MTRTARSKLHRWWTPPELAKLWGMDPKTARAHLRRINCELGNTLFREDAKRVRILGSALEQAVPGSLTPKQTKGDAHLLDVRRIMLRLVDIESWRDETDEWRAAATSVIGRLTERARAS